MNNKNAYFTQSAGLKRKRHLFPMPFSVKTTMNAGQLVPLMVQEVLPGGEWKINMSQVLRGLTPLYPVMDDAFIDIYAFFAPCRTLWKHWESFRVGAATSTPGSPEDYSASPAYTVPRITFNSNSPSPDKLLGTFWDYAGVGVGTQRDATVGVTTQSLSALPPRGYVKIWNEWFRNENYQQPAVFYDDDVSRSFLNFAPPAVNSTVDLISPILGGSLLPVTKFSDYFTSALPQLQKGQPVIFPLAGSAPITGYGEVKDVGTSEEKSPFLMNFYNMSGIPLTSPVALSADYGGSTPQPVGLFGEDISHSSKRLPILTAMNVSTRHMSADLSQATAVSVNLQRLAFATQRFREQLARTGSRYQEYLQGVFGVYASDSRLDRSEFLGGKRIPIRQHQVAQTAETEQDIGLGATGAFSFTAAKKNICRYTAKEDGWLYVLACIRTNQSYSQGIPKQFQRFTQFDYYQPIFAHIGEQPIYQKELYWGSDDTNDLPFGYKEAWAEYRYLPDRLTGYMRPNVSGSLAQWHYGINLQKSVVNSAEFIIQRPTEIDRTLAVPSENTHQFFGDFYFNCWVYNVMPIRSVPSLIDHDYY